MDLNHRFGGVKRLVGSHQFDRLNRAHVGVVGLGGVGSWAAEALARSGVGTLTLIDYDDICESNINRQIHSMSGSVGRQKIDVMKERLLDINSQLQVLLHHERFDFDTAKKLLANDYDVIIDATDQLEYKCLMIDLCLKNQIEIVTVGGSAGKIDPTQVHCCDLAKTHGDRLLQKTRKKLRQKYGFSRDLKKSFGVSCIYSSELPRFPDQTGEVTCSVESRPAMPMDCATGMGSAAFLTGTFGFFAAYACFNLLGVTEVEQAKQPPSLEA